MPTLISPAWPSSPPSSASSSVTISSPPPHPPARQARPHEHQTNLQRLTKKRATIMAMMRETVNKNMWSQTSLSTSDRQKNSHHQTSLSIFGQFSNANTFQNIDFSKKTFCTELSIPKSSHMALKAKIVLRISNQPGRIAHQEKATFPILILVTLTCVDC